MKSNITIGDMAEYRAKSAILLYEGGGKFWASHHGISIDAEQQMHMLPGQALTEETLAEALKALLNEKAEQLQILPDNVLFSSSRLLIWRNKRVAAPIYFKTAKSEINALNGMVVNWPPAIFVASSKGFRIFSHSSSAVNGETPLCHYPAYNIYNTGYMCPGNVKLPSVYSISAIPDWEKCFYQTSFTHSNHRDFLNVDLAEFWISSPADRPTDALVAFGKTLQEVLNEYA
jgi:PRTRC genetic system protein B